MKAPFITLVLLTVLGCTNAFSWTYHRNFNTGIPGNTAQGADGFDGTAGRSYYTTEKSYEGGQGAELNILEGIEGFGTWGGMFDFPSLSHGDEFWFRLRINVPADFDYTAAPRLNFLRLHTVHSDNSNGGYNDIYINPLNSGTGPFLGIKEKHDVWHTFGTWSGDGIVTDTWETYEFYVKLDPESIVDGGTGVMRLWKNGKLLGEHQNIRTLTSTEDQADFFYLFTYWNSDPYSRSYYSEGEAVGTFLPGEDVVVGSTGKTFRVKRVYSNKKLEVYSPLRGSNYLDIVSGDVLTGLTSGASFHVDTIKMQYPVQDQHLYIDDVIFTNERPPYRDDFGNYYLGYQASAGLEKVIQPLQVVTGQAPQGMSLGDDRNGDGRIGVVEAISRLNDTE